MSERVSAGREAKGTRERERERVYAVECAHRQRAVAQRNRRLQHGVEGILRVYRESLDSTALSGPTNFEQIIRMASGYARAFSSQQVRHVRRTKHRMYCNASSVICKA